MSRNGAITEIKWLHSSVIILLIKHSPSYFQFTVNICHKCERAELFIRNMPLLMRKERFIKNIIKVMGVFKSFALSIISNHMTCGRMVSNDFSKGLSNASLLHKQALLVYPSSHLKILFMMSTFF